MSDSTERTVGPAPPRGVGPTDAPRPTHVVTIATRVAHIEDEVQRMHEDVARIAEKMDARFDVHENRTAASIAEMRTDIATMRGEVTTLRTDLIEEMRAGRKARERCWAALGKAAHVAADKVDGRILTAILGLAILAAVAGFLGVTVQTEWGSIGTAVEDVIEDTMGGGD